MARRNVILLSLFLILPNLGWGQTREKIRVALGSISVNSSVIPIGAQHGLFAKHGIDLEPIYMGGGMNSLAAVTSNSVQSNKLDYTIFAAPDIKSPQDLKVKMVTGTRPGASADSALRLYLRRQGLTPDKDGHFYFGSR